MNNLHISEPALSLVLEAIYDIIAFENFLKPISETKFGRDLSVKGCKRGKDRISRKYVDIRLINTK